MCLHPKEIASTSDLNKFTEELNETYTDMDSLSEFSGYCKYLSDGNDLASRCADLHVLHLNVQSILPVQSDLCKMLINSDIDVCTLNETWFNKKNRNFLKLHDYECITTECVGGKKGGGVGIAIHKRLRYHRKTDLEEMSDLEICIAEITCHHKNILIVSLYRAPNTLSKDFINSYKKLVDCLYREKDKHVIIGIDHNYDLLKSGLHNAMHEFIDCNLDHDLWPIITKLTCIMKTTATLIDNIIVSPGIYSSYLSGIIIENLSDHLPCLLVAKNIKFSKKEIPVITSRKITLKTISMMKE